MELKNFEYPLAYAPIPKWIVKHEPTEEPNMEKDKDINFVNKKHIQTARSVGNSGEHSYLDGVDSFNDESTTEDLVPIHSFAGPSKLKQKPTGIPLPTIGHPEEIKEKPFNCKKCGTSFKLEIYLKKHLDLVCGIGPKLLCKECGHQFKRKGDLQRHLMNIHNVEKSQLTSFGAGPKIRPGYPFKCCKCDKTYKHKCSLKSHLIYECGVDPSFCCTQCDYRASVKSSLTKHIINVHSGSGFS